MKIGDKAKLKNTEFEFIITGFTEINGQKMVCSDYGDFNIDLIDQQNQIKILKDWAKLYYSNNQQ
jgi:hypothetical protein